MVTQYRAGDRLREEKAGSGTRSAALLAFQADALEHISDAVVVIDPRQEVVYFGPGAERLYGISAPDAIGRPLQSCYQSIWDTPQAEAAAIAALSQEGRWRGENTHILRNGERRRVESTVTLMRDVAGKQCGMLTVIRDISKRWRLEQLLRESEERYRELFERLAVEHAALARLHKLSARLASQDELQTLLDAVLDAAMDLTGAPRGTLQVYDSATESLHIVCSRGFERDFLDFFAIVERQNGSFGRAMSFSGERVIVEDVRKSPLFMGTQAASVLEAAQVRAVQSTPLLGRDGNLLGIISTQWAEPHHPDDSAFRMFDLLAREAADLIEHRQREQGLRESGRRKDEFLAILSHELRNPLSAISTGVSLVERVPPGSDQAKRALRVIERQARQMGRLIDDLLDLTRISRGKIRLQQQSIELNHLLRRTADDHWALFEENGVRLELSLSHQPVYVNGDEVRLAQVVENLLHN
ncbi:MAG TPA: histidine kinase dimerization/phospho-acceptor domain-containing protein, partial [Myxococcaceae bacterium]|nr:histidine kinase dimerization/phospho-acceptor domain-containing protein [Myxococcaceae bacterium]